MESNVRSFLVWLTAFDGLTSAQNIILESQHIQINITYLLTTIQANYKSL